MGYNFYTLVFNSVANFGVILSDGIRLLLKWHASILNIDYMYLFLKKFPWLKNI